VANSLLTISMITREAVRLWKNTNNFLRAVDTQYDDQFARTGAKIGSSVAHPSAGRLYRPHGRCCVVPGRF
jgi:hypothetical protein